MTRLNWDARGERFYETGVSRGVLYVGDNAGVAWTGLISVDEAPTGGEPRAFYQDGVKYLNLSASEEFAATINAFSSPPEFAPCDGVGAIQNGLFATQQRRRAFGLSYRTLIGNDTEGRAKGYKIHLVYNALAAPSQVSRATLSDNVDPTRLSWSVTTLPPSLSGLKPTAHFVIDSRYTPAGLMKHIEDILYGTSEQAPRLPPASEVVALFQSEGPVLYTNEVLAPVGPSTSSTTGWRPSSGEQLNFVADDDGLPALEVFDSVGGGIPYADPNFAFGSPDWAGKYVAFGADVKPMTDYDLHNFRLRISGYIGVVTSALPGDNSYRPLVEGRYSRISIASFVEEFPSGGYIRTLLWPNAAPNLHPDPNMASGVWATLSSGVSIDAAGTGYDGVNDRSVLIQGSTGQVGSYSFTNNAPVGVPTYGIPVLPGEELAVSAYVRGASTIPINGARIWVRFYDLDNSVSVPVATKAAASNTVAYGAAYTQLSGIVKAPEGDYGPLVAVVGLYKEAVMTDAIRWSRVSVLPLQRFRFRNMAVAVGDTPELALAAVANPLSGDLIDQGGYNYSWEGSPNNSRSFVRTWN